MCDENEVDQLDYALAKSLQQIYDEEAEDDGPPSKRLRTLESDSSVGDRLCVRLLHLSDTHNMQDQIEKRFPFPDADILLHTGDLTNRGSMGELRKVNEWLGKIAHRFKHIVVIGGNHDVHGNKGKTDLKKVLSNATVLDHELAQDVLKDFDLVIYGSPWVASKPCHNPGGRGHLFDKIPSGIDVLMTHGPPKNIFDSVSKYNSWGSSFDLNNAIMKARPRVHLFGHLHEQRGVWQRDSSGRYTGGVEYEAKQGTKFPTKGPPPRDWPCDVVSCNAMTNHPGKEEEVTGKRSWQHIAGPPRLILAERASKREQWRFVATK